MCLPLTASGERQTRQQLPISSHCVGHRAMPELASYEATRVSDPLPGLNDEKQSRFLRCLRR